MSRSVVVHGMAGSSNVQTVLMTLAEKGVPGDLVSASDFAAYKRPPYLAELHPFGMVPAFQHGDFRLYETQAIIRYVDEAFDGPPLQPADLRRRTRMNQLLSLAQAYFPGVLSGGGGINFHRLVAAKFGLTPDEAAVQAAIPKARVVLAELERLLEEPYLVGEVSLADLMVAPVLFVLELSADGADLLAATPKLAAWLQRMKARPSGALMREPQGPA